MFGIAAPSHAQVLYGSIVGNVKDASDASVAGALVTLTNTETKQSRQATTTVRLKDGNGVIIAGLLSEERTQTITKVPVLGDIPLVGYLFQHHSIDANKKDLVIEVTPRILPEQR